MLKTVAMLALVALGACSTIQKANDPVDMTTPAQAAYALKSAYGAALAVAIEYARLPRCGQPASPPLCSDAAVLGTMRRLSEAADAATQGAEDAVRTLGKDPALVRAAIVSAQAAVSTFEKTAAAYGGKR